MLHLATFVTDFADQAVILPLTVVVAVALWVSGWKRGALIWTGVILLTLAFMLVLKVGFRACGHLFPGAELISPSGHAAAAGVLYGSIFAFLAERVFGKTILTLLSILITVAIVGVSRVLLGAHTIPEVVAGAVVGGIAAWLMVKNAGEPGRASPGVLVLLPLCAIIFLFHGVHLRAETSIRDYATEWSIGICR